MEELWSLPVQKTAEPARRSGCSEGKRRCRVRSWMSAVAEERAAIDPLASHQHLRRTILADPPRLQHDDPIEIAQARQPVCDCDDGSAAHQAIQCLADGFLRIAVER